ncbi:AI-2E family transporter [uncultured Winogradskyella sp.]|uniref:AI-2E family transporter n=1 Tax=uncultured Winogradskyella sp. TaxID=395353 RepID=UPI0030DDCE75|tara:strand:+ start:15236 stop:16255 length:1020 start_codon:yes stop_codon:yes gene_type:complete
MIQIESKIIRQIFVLLLIIGIGSLIFWKIRPYFSGVLGAITFYVLLKNIMKKMVYTYNWRPSLAAATIITGSFFVVIIPLIGFGFMLGHKILDVANSSKKITDAIKVLIENFEAKTSIAINTQIDTQAVTTFFSQHLQFMAGNTFNLFIAIGLMYFLLYYMLINQNGLGQFLSYYLPMSSKNMDEVTREINAMVKSNAIGIPLVALVQGVIALIGFLIFGIEDALFWFVITTFGSLIPFVGISIGILPVFLLTLSQGYTFQAWGILIYSTTIVSATDNLIRLYILKKLDNVHPLITLIGVLIGIPLFGFIGVIFGPLLLSLFIVLVKIYKTEYGSLLSN